jgi:hypothetical protein
MHYGMGLAGSIMGLLCDGSFIGEILTLYSTKDVDAITGFLLFSSLQN